MNAEVILRIIVGIAGSYLTYYVVMHGIRRAALKDTEGKLFFGGFIQCLAIVCTAITLLMFWVLFYTNHGGQEVPIFCLIAMFGVSAVYSWAEMFWTNGFFNDDGMGFQSLWLGRRNYKWPQLVEVTFNQHLYWYVLRFENAKPVRISVYLNGHGDLLNKIESLGYQV